MKKALMFGAIILGVAFGLRAEPSAEAKTYEENGVTWTYVEDMSATITAVSTSETEPGQKVTVPQYFQETYGTITLANNLFEGTNITELTMYDWVYGGSEAAFTGLTRVILVGTAPNRRTVPSPCELWLKLPEEVTTLENYSFYEDEKWYYFGDGYTDDTFDGLILSTGVESISPDFLAMMREPAIEVPKESSYFTMEGTQLFSKDKTVLYRDWGASGDYKLPVVRRVEAKALYKTEITTLTIPEGVEEIGSQAFGECASLSYYSSDSGDHVPSSLTKMCIDAFSGCTMLYPHSFSYDPSYNPYSLPNFSYLTTEGVEDWSGTAGREIMFDISNIPGGGAYYGFSETWGISFYIASNGSDVCGMITSEYWQGDTLTGPAGSLDLGIYLSYASDYYTDTSSWYPYSVFDWQMSGWSDQWSSAQRYIMTGSTTYNSAPPYITEVVVSSYEGMPGSVSVKSNQFSGCSSLRLVPWEQIDGDIPPYAFYGTAIPLLSWASYPEDWEPLSFGDWDWSWTANSNAPSNTYRIEEYAFSGSSLHEVLLPSQITYIGQYAFADCFSLQRVYLEDGEALKDPYSPWTIDNYAFYNCTSLSEVRLPEGLEQIGEYAFANTELTSIKIPSTVTSIGGEAFTTTPGLSEVIFAEGTETITSGFSGYTTLTKVGLPSTLKTIEARAFEGCTGLTEIVIPEGVEVIPAYAFSGCSSLTEVVLPSSIKRIDAHAFDGCSALTTLTLPEGLESIGAYALNGCSSLQNAVLPSTVTSIGEGAFNGSSVSGAVTLPEDVTEIAANTYAGWSGLTAITIPATVKSIGANAFLNCTGLTEIVIPEGVETIGDCAFNGCSNVKRVILPASLLSIGTEAFVGVAPEILQTPTANLSGMTMAGVTTLNIPEGVTAVTESFASCTALEQVTLPSTLESIGGNAFEGLQGLAEIVIPEGVTEIGDYAFRGCTGLEKITLPTTLKTLGVQAFAGCPGFTQVELPDGMTEIAANAFKDCANLTSIKLPSTVKSIGVNAFLNCTGLTEIVIPEGVTAIGDYAFKGCTNLATITLPTPLPSIGVQAFAGCPGFTQMELPEGMTAIAANAFKDYDNLTAIKLPSTVKSIGANAFLNCTGLTEIVIPEGVETIAASAFKGCSQLREVTLPTTLKTIGANAFEGCAIKTLTLPAGVTSIGDSAFAQCVSLKTLTLELGLPSSAFGEEVFAGCAPTALNAAYWPKGLNRELVLTVTLPAGVTAIEESAFDGCKGLTALTLPEEVTEIGNYAFRGCANLSGIALPTILKTIGAQAFAECWAITEIEIANPEVMIGMYAFAGCSGVKTVSLAVLNLDNVDANTFYGVQPTTLKAPRIPEGMNGSKIATLEIPEGVEALTGSFVTCTKLKTLVLPSTLKSIGANTFSGLMELETVMIPEGVESVGANAFNGCSNLTTITLPSTLKTIGLQAFAGCPGFMFVELPEGMVTIDADTFKNYEGLKSVTLPSSVKVIGANAFAGCTGLTEITLPEHLERIEAGAFEGCVTLQRIKFPSTLVSIGENAFKGCEGLPEIVLTNPDVEIGSYAFAGCTGVDTVSLTMTSSANVGTAAFEDVKPRTLKVSRIPTGMDVSGVTTLEIPEGVEALTGSFVTCSALNTLVLPSTLKSIGASTFSGLTGLTELILPEGLTSIGANAFRACTNLTRIVLPSTLETLGKQAFTGCPGFAALEFHEGITEIADNLLKGCEELVSIKIPATVKVIGASAFEGCIGLTTIEIPEGVTTIGDDAFAGCTGLKQITFPSTLKTIGASAFEGAGLTSVEIPVSVVAIGEKAFYECTALEALTFAEGEGEPLVIGAYAFYSTQLETLSIPSRLTNIPAYAFGRVETIEFLGYVEAIADYAFQGASSVTFYKGIGSLGGYAFSTTDYEAVTITLYAETLPDWIENNSFGHSIHTLMVPEGTTSLGRDVTLAPDDIPYARYARIQRIVVPASVTFIGSEIWACGRGLIIDVHADNEHYKTIDGMLLSKDGTILYNGNIISADQRYVVPEGVKELREYSLHMAFDYMVSEEDKPHTVEIPDCVERVSTYAFGPCVFNNSENTIRLPSHLSAVMFRPTDTSVGDLLTRMETTTPDGITWTFRAYHDVSEAGDASREAGYYDEACLARLPMGVAEIESVSSASEALNASLTLPEALCGYKVAGVSASCTFNASEVVATYTPSEAWTNADGSRMFAWNNVTHLIVPEGVTEISAYAFEQCSSLRSVEFRGDIEKIGDYAFAGCTGLEQIVFPTTVTTIGASAFEGSGLTSLNLPATLNSVGERAFAECANLKTLTLATGLPSTAFSETAFAECVPTALNAAYWPKGLDRTLSLEVTLPEDLTTIEANAFAGCTGLEQIVFPAAVTTIGASAFEGSGLTSLNLPATLNSVGERAFAECTNLKTLTLATGLPSTAFSETAFTGCVPTALNAAYWPKGLDRTLSLEVTLPEDLTTIEANAFAGCTGLEQIDLPATVTTIGTGAFKGCLGFKELELPDTLQKIEDEAFQGCSNLERLVLPQTIALGRNVFAGTSPTTLVAVTLPEGMDATQLESIPLSGITAIGEGQFANHVKLRSIDIPEGVTVIGKDAFKGCTVLETITLPSTLERIEAGAFEGCVALQPFTLPTRVMSIGKDAFAQCESLYHDAYGVRYESKARELLITSPTERFILSESIRFIHSGAFKGKAFAISPTLPETLVQIGEEAFAECSGIETISLTARVEVCSNAFLNVKPKHLTATGLVGGMLGDALETLTLLEGVETIEANAFKGCKALSSVSLPSTLREIGDGAFEGCEALTTFNLPASLTAIGATAFKGCGEVERITLTSDVTIGDEAFGNVKPKHLTATGLVGGMLSDALETLTLLEGVETIEVNTFKGCETLHSVSLPSTLQEIGDGAFEGCEVLSTVNLPASLTTIGATAFKGCVALETIDVPEGVITIGTEAFAQCSLLTSVTLPEGLTTLAGGLFDGCVKLQQVESPVAVTIIGDAAFRNCAELKSFTFSDTLTALGNEAFAGCTTLKEALLPDSLETLGMGAFASCTQLAEVRLPSTVTVLPAQLFAGCEALETVELPHELTEVGVSAFKGCTALTAIILPQSVYSVGSEAFAECAGVETVTLPNLALVVGTDAFRGIKPKTLLAAKLYDGMQCHRLETLTLIEGVTTIEKDFMLATELTHVDLPEGLTVISDTAFAGCVKLQNLRLPKTLKCIGALAFQDCVALEELTLPSRVEQIGDDAFLGCKALTQVYFLGKPPTVENSAFPETTGSYLFVHKDAWLQVIANERWDGLTMKCADSFEAPELPDVILPEEVFQKDKVATWLKQQLILTNVSEGQVVLSGATTEALDALRLLGVKPGINSASELTLVTLSEQDTISISGEAALTFATVSVEANGVNLTAKVVAKEGATIPTPYKPQATIKLYGYKVLGGEAKKLATLDPDAWEWEWKSSTEATCILPPVSKDYRFFRVIADEATE